MSKKAKSLQQQMIDYCNEIYTPGVSRFKYRQEHGEEYSGIAGDKTKKKYLGEWVNFARWVNRHTSHQCKSIEDARQYVTPYMETYAENHASSSCTTVRSALAKLYHVPGLELIKKKFFRPRNEIKNNRGELRPRWEKNHKDACDFVHFTGLRRSGLITVRAKDYRGNGLFVLRDKDKAVQTKGGRPRSIQVLPQHIERIEQIIEECRALRGDDRPLFDKSKVPKDAQTHQYRSLFATEYYNCYARPLETLERKEIYYCRGDRKGEKFDKKAMLITSQQLGHNRLDVIARSYLRV